MAHHRSQEARTKTDERERCNTSTSAQCTCCLPETRPVDAATPGCCARKVHAVARARRAGLPMHRPWTGPSTKPALSEGALGRTGTPYACPLRCACGMVGICTLAALTTRPGRHSRCAHATLAHTTFAHSRTPHSRTQYPCATHAQTRTRTPALPRDGFRGRRTRPRAAVAGRRAGHCLCRGMAGRCWPRSPRRVRTGSPSSPYQLASRTAPARCSPCRGGPR